MTQPVVKLRNISLGSGRPKLAVPITGKTTADILAAVDPIKMAAPDVVEWRIDFFEGVTDAKQLQQTGQWLRSALGSIALLTTFRTHGEGGALELSDADYFKVCENVLAGKFTDALDVERYHDEADVKGLVAKAHDNNVVVIMSNHDFDKTPSKKDIVGRLTSMVDFGADVAKMAVMPQSADDVLTLLTATNEARKTLSQPVITMSMGDLGKVSRLAGEVFGSCLSFATVGAASAPGQIALDHLRPELEDLKLS
ncbi:type I 3-dehydroquinate dehydratase [Lactiplantibacillus xiangfangensis]|uniref:3-dehydroquinate dehydratase n=1 Tax=Lactiplantibacillus xiangfangensis TaxID=942150 RepID=A0A0R2MPK4_9LACO|nr:type I 3-dehydroquinate dehydratase [Lactiplantibacillus xiangfangensis]KRO14011.1 (3-dehydroquinate dehydratase) [Lactiplantibacillus xiangfangensis]